MDSREWYQVSLEFTQIHVEGTTEPEGSGNGGYDLANELVEVAVSGPTDA